jgi:tRNA modification GTPase
MFATDDTIVAIATPAGRGALGVIRVSGPRALDIVRTISSRRRALEPRRATLTRIVTASGASSSGAADSVVATYFKAPHSYTGDDVVELSAHGSPVILRGIVHAAIGAGARLARPWRIHAARLSCRPDRSRAGRAVADLIASATPLQARVAFDQLEGTLTDRIAALDATLFDVIARLEASLDFPDEGYHFIDQDETQRRLRDGHPRH